MLEYSQYTGALRTGFVRKSFPDCFSIAIVCESGNECYLSAYKTKARKGGSFSGICATQLRYFCVQHVTFSTS